MQRIRTRKRRPRLSQIRLGAPVEDIKAAVKMKYYVSDASLMTIEVRPRGTTANNFASVNRIRFRGCPYDIFIVFGSNLVNFGTKPYQPGEVIYYHRSYPETIYREIFMISADEVRVRPPKFRDPQIIYTEGTREPSPGERIMFEPCVYGKPWVDLMWTHNIESLEAIDRHFRNPEMNPILEGAFTRKCNDFHCICQLALDGEISMTL